MYLSHREIIHSSMRTSMHRIDHTKPPLKCPPGFIMTFEYQIELLFMTVMEGSSQKGINSIKCDPMTGEWTRSDGKPLAQNGTFWCKKESKETPEVLFMAALWCVCAFVRRRLKNLLHHLLLLLLNLPVNLFLFLLQLLLLFSLLLLLLLHPSSIKSSLLSNMKKERRRI
ncbi:hypothetical protein PRIPAC_84756 [Pristionchus pacificus]|nr:hypothetical protein PRIPAC_84756 [Pristionchus pacificus]